MKASARHCVRIRMKAGAGDFQTRSAQKEKRHRKTFSSTSSLLAKFYGSFCNSAPQTFSQAPISQTPFSAYPKPPPLPPPHMQSNKKLQTDCMQVANCLECTSEIRRRLLGPPSTAEAKQNSAWIQAQKSKPTLNLINTPCNSQNGSSFMFVSPSSS